MSRLARAWERWVDFWDEREAPTSLALVRICLGLCLLWDFGQIGGFGLVDALFGVGSVDGLADAMTRNNIPWFYEVFPATLASARGLWVLLMVCATTFTLGLFTRTSALVLVIAWVQFGAINPYADRGIDTLCRLILMILVFAPSGGTLSLDAWRRTGSWIDASARPAWTRKLLILQLVLMYFSAGIMKTGVTWWPWGGSSALYFALQDPAVARWDFFTWRSPIWFAFTAGGATVTLLYQWTYPTVLLLMWWRRNPGRGGRLAAFANRWRLEFIWVGLGAIFHISLAATMELGIFPWAMMALYPVWLAPHQWTGLWEGARNLVLARLPRRAHGSRGPGGAA